jgi:hypothetical protein
MSSSLGLVGFVVFSKSQVDDATVIAEIWVRYETPYVASKIARSFPRSHKSSHAPSIKMDDTTEFVEFCQ